MNEYRLPIFDTHAHYDNPLFEGKGPKIVNELKEFGLDKVVIPAITFDSNFSARVLFPEREFPNVYFGPGLHPKCAINEKEWDSTKQRKFEELLSDSRTVAVKSGLDLTKKKLQDVQITRQRDFFEMMVNFSNQFKLPMILHIRDASTEAIDFLRNHRIDYGGVVHCYVYDKETTKKFLDSGILHYGIGGMITRPEMGQLRESVEYLPMESILLETDAPFVKPFGFEGKLNNSANIITVAEEVGKIKKISVEKVLEKTYENSCAYYQKKGKKA